MYSRRCVEEMYEMLQSGRSHAELRRLAAAKRLSRFDLALLDKLDRLAQALGISFVSKPRAAIFGLDGTLVDGRAYRHLLVDEPQDLDGYMEGSRICPPNPQIRDLYNRVVDAGILPLVVTSRCEQYRQLSEDWLACNDFPHAGVWMRAQNDDRHDPIVKRDLLNLIRRVFDPILTVDDNPWAVEMWIAEGVETVAVPGYLEHVVPPEPIRIDVPSWLLEPVTLAD